MSIVIYLDMTVLRLKIENLMNLLYKAHSTLYVKRVLISRETTSFP